MSRLLVAAALLLATPAVAQASAANAATQAIPAPKLELAGQLVRLLDLKSQMMQPLLRMQAQMRSGSTISKQFDANPAMRLERAKDPPKWDATAKRIGAIQAGALQSIFDDVAPLVEKQSIESYARNFSEEDLRGLVQFYQTPLGQRLAEKNGQISLDSAAFVQSTVVPRIAKEMQRIQPQIQAEMRGLMPAKGK